MSETNGAGFTITLSDDALEALARRAAQLVMQEWERRGRVEERWLDTK